MVRCEFETRSSSPALSFVVSLLFHRRRIQIKRVQNREYECLTRHNESVQFSSCESRFFRQRSGEITRQNGRDKMDGPWTRFRRARATKTIEPTAFANGTRCARLLFS